MKDVPAFFSISFRFLGSLLHLCFACLRLHEAETSTAGTLKQELHCFRFCLISNPPKTQNWRKVAFGSLSSSVFINLTLHTGFHYNHFQQRRCPTLASYHGRFSWCWPLLLGPLGMTFLCLVAKVCWYSTDTPFHPCKLVKLFSLHTVKNKPTNKSCFSLMVDFTYQHNVQSLVITQFASNRV